MKAGKEGTTRLRDVVKAVRACKTAAEERSVISEESAQIRASFRLENCPYHHRNVAKLIFFAMLGYTTNFAHVQCLKLIVSRKYVEKKMGYLALVQLMGEEDELTLMAISSIKADLASDKSNIVGMALCAVANTANTDMCRELAIDIGRLISGGKAAVRAKAILAAARVVRKCPDLIEDFVQLAVGLVEERQTQTLGASVSLMLEIIKQDPDRLGRFAVFNTSLQRSLKDITRQEGHYELTIHNVVDPFTQCRLIELLRCIGKSTPQEAAQMESTLSSLLSSTEMSKQTGRAMVYECCKTILEIESSQALKTQALNMLDSMLISKENNTRFIALKALAREALVSPDSVHKFRSGVLSCLQDPDKAVATKALELLVLLVNEDNVKVIVRDLLHLLTAVEGELKEAIATKLCLVAELHKYDQPWYLETMVKVLELTKDMGEDTVARTANTILSSPDLQDHAVKLLFFALREHSTLEGLGTLGLWCIGEYAHLLIGGKRPPELPPLPTPNEVVELLQLVLTHSDSLTCKQYALTALAKVAVRIPSEISSCRYVLESESLSPSLELQQRACEYLELLDGGWESLRPALFAAMPSFDKEVNQPAVPSQPSPEPIPCSSLLEMDLLGDVRSPGTPPALNEVFRADPTQPHAVSNSLTIDAYSDSNLSITFHCSKEDPRHPEVTLLTMAVTTHSPVPLEQVKISPLAPKNLKVSLFAPSAQTLTSTAPVTQDLRVINASHGQKPIALKLQIQYERQGTSFRAEQVVSSFPAYY